MYALMCDGKIILIVSALLTLISCNGAIKQNRLSDASSPYLKQHADNPVEWYEWGKEALDKAKKENKPLLISIGYASCHWCHEMEKESFMDSAVARIMNQNFICIKVDREERPDIDNIYMNACQLITGGKGGWPLNAFALPDGKPFFAGTYYSKESWVSLLNQVAGAYKNQYNKVLLQADALTNEIVNTDIVFLSSDITATAFSKSEYLSYFKNLIEHIDFKNGGLKGSPKFPMPSVWEFLLQYYYLYKDPVALDAVVTALKKMALGGIYDHVGGGFARYSTDSLWHIPHFEKMLYDNAQLMSLYAHAYQVTEIELFKTVVYEIASFMERELMSAEGGFYSSINADTEEGEGNFYAWKYNELIKLFGANEGEMMASYYSISSRGNWEAGKSIFFAKETPDEFEKSGGHSLTGFKTLLKDAKKTLLAERNKRPRPAADNKILTAWNALALKGYADAYSAFGDSIFLQKALLNAAFIERNMIKAGGSLLRSYVGGKVSVTAFLDDYAFLARAYIRLYQVTFDKRWLEYSRSLTEYTIKNFYDEVTFMFYYTASGPDQLVVRKMELSDNVIPSSNAVMADVLYNLGVYFNNEQYTKMSQAMISKIAANMNKAPSYYTQWGYMGGLFSHGTYEVAVMGKEAHQRNLALQKNFLPVAIFMGHTEKEDLPLLEDKLPENKTLIYVCTNRVCKFPVEDVKKALEQIK